MNSDELKEKICDIIAPYVSAYGDDERIADALIAAGLTFGNKHRVFVENAPIPTDYIGNECFLIPNTPPTIKQLYGDEEVEKMAKERKGLKDELRSKVEYIHEQDEVIKEYKHRAEVAERALRNALNDDTCYLCDEKIPCRCEHRDWGSDECIKSLLQQAEKELAEEGKE